MSDIAVIGAGPAGVSVALSLRDRGLWPLLIDRSDHVASSWRSRYDRLKLNTGRPFSHLPNRPYPKGTATFPTRDDVVAHLDRHARESGIELRLGTEVTRIDRRGAGWRLETATGGINARQIVVAIGNQHTARIPEWPGADGFTAELLHSSEYRNPHAYQGRNVLVVGSGSSGMEIAHDLATGGAGKVWLAVRTPPNIMLRSLSGGLPGDLLSLPMYRLPFRVADAIGRRARRANLGDLSEFGLPIPQEGVFSRVKRLEQVPSLVDMDVIDAIMDGSILKETSSAWSRRPALVACNAMVRNQPESRHSVTNAGVRSLESGVGEQQVAVIGAGPAGVSVALSLRDRPTRQARRTRRHRTAVPRVPDSPVAHRSTSRRSKQVARAIARELSAA
jgi:cation diffusion facilitator CzcD-associated flavoprotein CzcO